MLQEGVFGTPAIGGACVEVGEGVSAGALWSPADAAGGVEEPVHEYSSTVVVWVVGQQAVPLVLLHQHGENTVERRVR